MTTFYGRRHSKNGSFLPESNQKKKKKKKKDYIELDKYQQNITQG